MLILYRVIIFLYCQFIRIAALFNSKARKWVEGRRDIFDKIANTVNSNEYHTWFHFASLGEFEQGRPVLEQYQEEWPDRLILITFYSPSGYEVRKNYSSAAHVFYLPIDTPKNARRLVALIRPQMVFFTKYDYWYFIFRELRENNIPLYMVSSIYRKDQVFFKWYGGFFRKMLGYVDHFFVQNEESVQLMQNIGFANVTLTGDTRFDRVIKVAKMAQELPVISYFTAGSKVLVAGSTWVEDIEMLAAFHRSFGDWKIIIAPHEISDSNIRHIIERFPEGLLYSALSTSDLSNPVVEHKSSVLIVNNVGMLSSLYGYAEIAYIGGGFGAGIHNTLEAAAYGIPVLFGPRFHKFQEAKDLIHAEAAFSFNDAREFVLAAEELMNETFRLEAGKRAMDYVHAQAGATDRIVDFLKEKHTA